MKSVFKNVMPCMSAVFLLMFSGGLYAQATDVDCNGCVNTGDIANQAVNRSKISNGAVGTAQIGNQQVVRGKISNGAVGTAQIGNQQITRGKIAPGAVGTSQIGNGQITRSKIADGSVTGDKLAAGAVALDPAQIIDEGNTDGDCIWNISGNSGSGYWDAASDPACNGQAAVQLPDEVTVTELECTFFSGQTGGGEGAILVRTDREAQTALAIFDTGSTIGNDTIQTVSDSTPVNGEAAVVDNSLYSYRLNVNWGDASVALDAQYSGCVVEYNQPLF